MIDYHIPAAIARRRAFLLAHDHLISPWKYHPQELMERDVALRTLNWQRESQRLDLPKLELIPKS